MSDFLNGWRRKVGLVTLLIACMFVGGWVRSIGWTDSISFRTGTRSETSVISSGGVVFSFFQTFDDPLDSFIPHISTNPGAHDFSYFMHPDLVELDWKLSESSFVIGKTRHMSSFKKVIFFAAAPYWSIAFPSTMVSCWLLLYKRRPKKATTQVESIPKTAA